MSSVARGLWRTVGREFRRIAGSRFLFWASGPAPVLLFLFLCAIFQNEVVRDLPVAYVDQDQSNLSRQLSRMLEVSDGISVRYPVAEPAEAERLVREGLIYGYVIVPRGTEGRVLRGEQAQVLGYHNAAFLSAGGVVSREFRTAVATLGYGIKQKRLAQFGVSAAPLEPVRVQSSALFNSQLNYAYFLIVALLPAMLQIFITIVSVEAAGSELRWGSAPEWMESAGDRAWLALAGKMLPYTLLFGTTTIIMITILFQMVEIPLRGSLLVITIASVLMVLAYQAIGVLLVAVTANLRMATSLAAFFTGPALAYMGISFPQMGMPAFGQFWGNLLPVTHYVRLLISQGIRGDRADLSLPDLAVLGLFIVVAVILSLARLPKIARDPNFWGRV